MAKQSKHKPRNVIEGEEFWKKWCDEFSNSNTTRKEFCAKNSLNYDRFHYWYRKFNGQQTTKRPLIPVKFRDDIAAPVIYGTIILQQGHRIMVHERNVLLEYLLGLQ